MHVKIRTAARRRSVVQVDVLVVMAGMLGVPVPIVQIVDVVVMLQCVVSAAGAVNMVVIAEVMLPVGSSTGHRSVDLPSRRCGSAGQGSRSCRERWAAPAGSLTVSF